MPIQQELLEIESDYNGLKDAMAQKHQIGTRLARQTKLVFIGQYDFSKSGGAVGAITLLNPITGMPAKLPKGAIITSCYIHTFTNASTAGSPTIAVGTGQAANDLKAATASSSFATSALLAGVPVGSAATAVVLTADSTMSITIATAALTAGKFNVVCEYMLSLANQAT